MRRPISNIFGLSPVDPTSRRIGVRWQRGLATGPPGAPTQHASGRPHIFRTHVPLDTGDSGKYRSYFKPRHGWTPGKFENTITKLEVNKCFNKISMHNIHKFQDRLGSRSLGERNCRRKGWVRGTCKKIVEHFFVFLLFNLQTIGSCFLQITLLFTSQSKPCTNEFFITPPIISKFHLFGVAFNFENKKKSQGVSSRR